MPCNATACVERTFIFCTLRVRFFFYESSAERTSEKSSSSSSKEGFLTLLCEREKVFVFFRFLGRKRENNREPFAEEWPRRPREPRERGTKSGKISHAKKRKGKRGKLCIKSKAYLLSSLLVRRLYSTRRLSHIYRER